MSPDGWKHKGTPRHWKNPEQTVLPTVIKFNVSEAALGPRRPYSTAGPEPQSQGSLATSYILVQTLLSMKTCEMFLQKSRRFLKLLCCWVHLPTKVLWELKLRKIIKNRKEAILRQKKLKIGKSFHFKRLAGLGFGVQRTEFDRRERISDHLNYFNERVPP